MLPRLHSTVLCGTMHNNIDADDAEECKESFRIRKVCAPPRCNGGSNSVIPCNRTRYCCSSAANGWLVGRSDVVTTRCRNELKKVQQGEEIVVRHEPGKTVQKGTLLFAMLSLSGSCTRGLLVL